MIRLKPCFIFFMFFFVLPFIANSAMHHNTSRYNHVGSLHVGVILDLSSSIGRMGWKCISMAVSDFYMTHSNHKTRLVLHLRDSQGDNAKAVFRALDLINNEEVQAIIGPQTSTEADFMIHLGDKAQVPIISFSATSSSLSFQTPYFIRAAQNDSSQLNSITSIIQAFKWREVIAIYEDLGYGNEFIPYLFDALQDIETKVIHRSVISPSATDDQVLEEPHKLMTIQTKVFVVHISESLGSRLFLKVKEVGMMSHGYVWIVTGELMNVLDSMDTNVHAAMQGVLGVKPYIKRSKKLDHFTTRWEKNFLQAKSNIEGINLNIFGLWAYDAVWALAMAADRVGATKSLYETPRASNHLTCLTTIRTSQTGSELRDAILKTRFKGLSGDFHLVNGQLQSSVFEILNVIGDEKKVVGFWTPEHGVSQELRLAGEQMETAPTVDIRGIVWPGESMTVPKGWMLPASGQKLQIGVPVKSYFKEFLRVDRDPSTNKTTVSGQVIDVFNSAMETLPYIVPYVFVPFQKADGSSAGNYNDLVYQVYLQRYDAVVGDVMITANRSLYVDFTLPYEEGGVLMVVPIKDEDRNNAWIFLKPLTKDLWLTSGAFFIITGFVIWVLEHRINGAFRGPPSQHVGMIFWFPLSTLVFAHRERIVSNLTRLVVIIWIFVVLILSSSYTASLSSRLTAQRLQPAITSIEELVKNGDYVGCQQGSFIRGLLKQQKFNESKFKSYNSHKEYHEALMKGSKNGGIAAYIDATHYSNLFMARYCSKYTVVGPIYKTDGVGFVFPKGSPLVADVSRAILKIKEGDKIAEIGRAWFGHQTTCTERGRNAISNNLNFHSFRALFIITGTVSSFALLVFLVIFLYKHKHVLVSADYGLTFWGRLQTMLKQFDKKDPSSYRFKRADIDVRREMEVKGLESSPGYTTNISICAGRSLSPVDVTTSTDLNLCNSLPLEETVDVSLSD